MICNLALWTRQTGRSGCSAVRVPRLQESLPSCQSQRKNGSESQCWTVLIYSWAGGWEGPVCMCLYTHIYIYLSVENECMSAWGPAFLEQTSRFTAIFCFFSLQPSVWKFACYHGLCHSTYSRIGNITYVESCTL